MIRTVNIIYFSPTKTTKNIVNAIVKGTGINKVNEFDVTTENLKETIAIPDEELTIFGTPVYGGRVPAVAVNRFKKIKTTNSLAVLVAVYGNRGFDDVLLELKDITNLSGFNTIAAGAFIGEHSYSIHGTEIAKNRPDNSDIEKAIDFGKQIIDKIDNRKSKIDDIIIPGNFPYREIKDRPAISPETIYSNCNKCGICVDVCSTHAISLNSQIETESDLCIWCCACVKYCPQNARTMNNDVIVNTQKWLLEKCLERREPEMFL